MIKKTTKKLVLDKETIATLDSVQLRHAVGGMPPVTRTHCRGGCIDPSSECGP